MYSKQNKNIYIDILNRNCDMPRDTSAKISQVFPIRSYPRVLLLSTSEYQFYQYTFMFIPSMQEDPTKYLLGLIFLQTFSDKLWKIWQHLRAPGFRAAIINCNVQLYNFSRQKTMYTFCICQFLKKIINKSADSSHN